MAADKINVTYTVKEDGSLGKIAKGADKAAASTDKASKSTKGHNKQQKGVAGLTSNSTKAFSKMTTGIEGGLVPAYAVLAANVFAVTAAFGALKRASAVEQLEEGLLFTGRAAGENLSLVTEKLKEITGAAVSTAEAMSAVAIGVSAGFSENQLEGLASVAKGASLALGRDMTDALDRLIRGAAKLEPEILDELGIMVRLDKASQDFADTLGKDVAQLTIFEKRMGFTNAIIEQGSNKFLALSQHMEANPFDKLSASFDNMAKSGINGLNTFFGPLASFFADNIPVMVGAMIFFGQAVAKQMIPALGNQAKAAAEAATAQSTLAKEEVKGLSKTKGRTKAAQRLIKAIEKGEQTTDDYRKALRAEATQLKSNTTRLANGKITQAEFNKRKAAGTIETARYTHALQMEAVARGQNTQVDALNMIQGGEMRAGLKLGLQGLRDEASQMKENRSGTKGLDRIKAKFSDTTKIATGRLRLFSSALLRAIPVIGQVIMTLGILKAAYDKFFGTKPTFLDKALEDNKTRLEEFPNIFSQLVSTFDLITESNAQFEAGLKVTVGTLGQIKTAIQDIRSAESADEISGVAQAQLDNENLIASILKQEAAFQKLGIARDKVHDGAGGYLSIKDGGVTQEDFDKKHARMLAASNKRLQEAEAAVGVSSASAVGATRLMLKEGIIQQQQIAALAKAKGNDELYSLVSKKVTQLQGLEAEFVKKISSDGTISAADFKATEDGVTAIVVGASAISNALNGAAEATTVMSKLKTNEAKTKGLYAAEIDAIKTVLDLTDQMEGGQKALNARYETAFDVFNVQATEQAQLAAKELAATGDKVGAEKILFESRRLQLGLRRDEMVLVAENAKQRSTLDQNMNDQMKEQINHGDKAAAAETKLAAMIIARIEMEKALNLEKALGRDLTAEELALLKAISAEKQAMIDKFKGYGASMTEAGGGAGPSAFLSAGGAVANAQAEVTAAGDSVTPEQTAALTAAKTEQMKAGLKGVAADMAKLGPEGELMSSAIGGALAMQTAFSTAFQVMNDDSTSTADRVQAGLAVAGAAINALGSLMAASSDAKIRGIDQEIAKEKQRDGTSKASVAKIAQLEKKKEQAARKAFEVNKKMKMASTVIATASGVMAMLSAEPQGPWNFALAAMVGAMGVASLAQIAGTSFQGGSSAAPAGPGALSMGERSNTVDLGKGNNAGGELAYMRGSSGQGTGATDFKPTPAFSGYKTKNRASGGYIVGEQGPEVFMPDTAGSIIPSGQSTGGSTNVSFNIQAIDASGVEDVLIAQKGQIIRMIREAANEHGEFFLENVREEAYQQ